MLYTQTKQDFSKLDDTNKLQLNSEKTEPMLIGTRQKLSSISFNTLELDDTTVPLSDSVKRVVESFSSTAHCPWSTSSVKPPSPATTSSVELVVSGSIFPP